MKDRCITTVYTVAAAFSLQALRGLQGIMPHFTNEWPQARFATHSTGERFATHLSRDT